MSEPDNVANKRNGMIKRVLLENIGGLAALIGIVFAAGQIYNKIDTVSDTLVHMQVQQDAQSKDIGSVKTDIAVLKTKVESIERKQ